MIRFRNTITSLKKQTALLSTIVEVIKSFFLPNVRQLVVVGVLSFFGSLFTAGGYLLLMPLTRYVTGSLDVIKIRSIEVEATPISVGFLLCIIVALVFAGIQVNYRYYVKTLDVMRSTIMEATVRGVQALKSINLDKRQYKHAIRLISGSVAFSCGYTMQQFASGLTNIVQMLVFLVVLFSINPAITLFFLVFVIISGLLMFKSMNKVSDAVSSRRRLSLEASQEYDLIADDLKNGQNNHETLRKNIQALYETGIMGEMLTQKLGVRHEKKRGPLFIEYLFPIALVLIPLVTFATGDLQQQAPQLVAYLFVLKNVAGTMQRFTASLISTGKFYAGLSCYVDLIKGDVPPDCLLKNGKISDEEDDD